MSSKAVLATPRTRFFGNALHVTSALNVCMFAICVIKYANPNPTFSVFDSQWAKDGFCVSNPDLKYWTSHDMCLYVDAIFSAFVGILYLCLRKTEGMESANGLVEDNVLGILLHGVGHGAIAYHLRNANSSQETAPKDMAKLMDFLSTVLPFLMFWLFLLKAAMKNVSFPKIFIMSVVSLVVNMQLPAQFGFTFVQTVLILAFSFDQLSRPQTEKDFAYALYAAIVSVPIGIVGWMESLYCSSLIIEYGGHLIYDAYIPSAIILFYLICWTVEKTKKDGLGKENGKEGAAKEVGKRAPTDHIKEE